MQRTESTPPAPIFLPQEFLVVALLACLVIALVVVGIFVDVTVSASPPVSGPTPRIVLAAPDRPFSLIDDVAYGHSSPESLTAAVFASAQRCMAHAGFVHTPTHLFTDVGADATLAQFWHDTLEHGYGRTDVVLGASSLSLPRETRASAAERRSLWRALTGRSVPTPLASALSAPRRGPGCWAAARRAVLSSVPLYQPRFALALRAMLRHQVTPQDASPSALRGWSTCMDAHNERGRYFDEEADWWGASTRGETLTQARARRTTEVTDAVADARCFLSYLYEPYQRAEARSLKAFARSHPVIRPLVAAALVSVRAAPS